MRDTDALKPCAHGPHLVLGALAVRQAQVERGALMLRIGGAQGAGQRALQLVALAARLLVVLPLVLQGIQHMTCCTTSRCRDCHIYWLVSVVVLLM